MMARKSKFDWASYCELYASEVRSGKKTIDQVPEQARQEVEALVGKQQASGWTLGKWCHPATGELRLYINSRDLWRGSKVWFTSQDGHAVANTQASELGAKSAAQKLADEVGSKFAGSFEAMLAAAK